MKTWIVAVPAFLLCANLAQAQVSPCDRSIMQDKRIPAENRPNLLKACNSNRTLTHCQELADERKLLGDAKTRFMQKCASVPLAPRSK